MFSRRTHHQKRHHLLQFLALTFLLIIWCGFSAPLLYTYTMPLPSNFTTPNGTSYTRSAGSSVCGKRRTDDEFTRAALRLVVKDMLREKAEEQKANHPAICEGTLRCALDTPWAINACAAAFREVCSDLNRDVESGPEMLLLQLQHLIPDLDGNCSPIKSGGGFLQGTEKGVLLQVSGEIRKMHKLAKQRQGLQASHRPFGELIQRKAGWSAGMLSAIPLSISHIFGGEWSDVQIVAASLSPSASPASVSAFFSCSSCSLADDVAAMVGASTITYLVLNDRLALPDDSPLMDGVMKAIADRGCEGIPLLTDARQLVIRSRCPRGVGATETDAHKQANVQLSLLWKRVAFAETSKPLLCEHLPDPIVLSSAKKIGTKAVLFQGHWRGSEVLVKVIVPHQYLKYHGLRDFMREEKKRSPLIHYPVFSCYSGSYDAIFQVQMFLSGYVTLQSLLLAPKPKWRISFLQRVEIAMQIICIFRFLHEEHPAGFFTYDDNHPSQYLLKMAEEGHFSVILIDIDTLQHARAGADADADPRYSYSNYSTTCRCFYCSGRSNCIFFNTREAYEACGQTSHLEAWNHENPEAVQRGHLCNGSSDMWFEAQLLYLLFYETAAWRSLNRNQLIHMIESNSSPLPQNTKRVLPAAYANEVGELLSKMFISRPKEVTVLSSLHRLCRLSGGCKEAPECPSPVPSSTGKYSSPLNLDIRLK